MKRGCLIPATWMSLSTLCREFQRTEPPVMRPLIFKFILQRRGDRGFRPLGLAKYPETLPSKRLASTAFQTPAKTPQTGR